VIYRAIQSTGGFNPGKSATIDMTGKFYLVFFALPAAESRALDVAPRILCFGWVMPGGRQMLCLRRLLKSSPINELFLNYETTNVLTNYDAAIFLYTRSADSAHANGPFQ
jgi:hypothetical protein